MSAPTQAERIWWMVKLKADCKVIDPGQAVCMDRINARNTEWQAKAVKQWYAPTVWVEPKARVKRQEIGSDGWPVQPAQYVKLH